MKKIYALYFNEKELSMKISCEKHWERQREFVEINTKEDVICYYNPCCILSFNRSALVKKANEIKKEWLENQYKNISKIANIQLK